MFSPFYKKGLMVPLSYNLTDLRCVKSLLQSHGKQLTKALGQNFLVDAQVPFEIAQSSQIDKECGVLEIGPGIGCLTVELAQAAKKVVAVEIDRTLLPILAETLAGFDNITVLQGDIMKLDLPALLAREFPGMPVRVVANLPYYITTPIVMKLLEEDLPILSVTVMVQKEVAARLCASPGGKEYGAITLAVNYFSRPHILFQVPAQSFFPAPKVDSTVISLELLDQPPVETDRKALLALVKTAFAQRRKTLVNCILSSGRYDLSKEELEEFLCSRGFTKTVRGETLGLADFAALCKRLEA